MRKTLASSGTIDSLPRSVEPWLASREIASVEVTSEDPSFVIESALTVAEVRDGERPKRGLKLFAYSLFDRECSIGSCFKFSETELERTQEFTLRWSDGTGTPFKEIVRQRPNLSLHGSTREIEDYQVSLKNVSRRELMITPGCNDSFATLSACPFGVSGSRFAEDVT